MRRPLWTLSCAALLIAGVALLASDAPGLTAAVIGAKPFSFLSVLGLSLIAVGGLAAGLEDKLARHQDANIRRDLLQEHLRTTGGSFTIPPYNPHQSLKRNTEDTLASHYASSPEIIHCFERYLLEHRREQRKDLLTELATPEFREFRTRAGQLIGRWNRMAAGGELVPVAIADESPARNPRYEGLISRMVYFAPREEREQWKNVTRKNIERARKSGALVAAHEIVNADAITEPDRLHTAGEIHWELENVMRKDYKPIGGPLTYGKRRPEKALGSLYPLTN